jgi:hypothetical protein
VGIVRVCSRKPGRRCVVVASCAVHGRRKEIHAHFHDLTAAPSMVQLGRVVLAACFDDFGEWHNTCESFRQRFLARLGELPIASTPIAPYEALYTALARAVEPAEAFGRLAEIPIPLHVLDHQGA